MTHFYHEIDSTQKIPCKIDGCIVGRVNWPELIKKLVDQIPITNRAIKA